MTDPRIDQSALDAATDALALAWMDSGSPRADAERVITTYLAAADNAATITTEWGTGLGDELMTWWDRAQAERQSASATATYDQGKTWAHTNPPVVFRTVTEWKEIPDDHPTA